MLKTCLERVRSVQPLVHNITNYVTVNDVANIILACGASPIMADEISEVEEITSICNALNINIGTLNERTISAMHLVGEKASELGHKILLDPVGVGASTLRTNTALELIKHIHFDVIRGNISEIKTLALGNGQVKGVDASSIDTVTMENLEESLTFLKTFASKTKSIIVVTGAIDIVTDGKISYIIKNGRSEMGRITGTGCQLSGMMSAYLAANPEHLLEAAMTSVCAMGVAGEIAWEYMSKEDGNATYRNRIIDAIYHLDGETLERRANYEVR